MLGAIAWIISARDDIRDNTQFRTGSDVIPRTELELQRDLIEAKQEIRDTSQDIQLEQHDIRITNVEDR